MARVRIENMSPLQTWDDVNLNLKEMGELEMAIEGIEAKMNEQIQDIKLDAELKAKPLKDKIEKLSVEIKGFVEENRAEIKGKTMNLNFGSVGFRQSTKILIKNAKAVISALRAKNMNDCIIVKESVDKDVLRGYPDEVIASVGAGKKVEDAFWYEVNREKLL
ncbi:hypothetical protein JCM15765_02410 [Paradesulfitobacterium aromaticivorans]